MEAQEIKICDKYLLTVSEAAKYFNIGERKIRSIVADKHNSPLYIQNGVKVLIRRKSFEQFLNSLNSL